MLNHDKLLKGINDDEINWEKLAFSSDRISLLQYHQVEKRIKNYNQPSDKRYLGIFIKITTKQTEDNAEGKQLQIQPITLIADTNTIKMVGKNEFEITFKHATKQNVLFWNYEAGFQSLINGNDVYAIDRDKSGGKQVPLPIINFRFMKTLISTTNWKYLGQFLKNDANYYISMADSSPSFFGIDDHSRMRNMGRTETFGSNIRITRNMPLIGVDELVGVQATFDLEKFYLNFC